MGASATRTRRPGAAIRRTAASRAAARDAARFGADYYRRYYDDPATRVADRDATATLAGFVAGYLRYLDVEVREILDIGCGRGFWRDAARRLWPAATWHGVEFSEHLCARHGWHRGSVVDFSPGRVLGRTTFDLVICQGVLQYLDDAQAARALRNLRQWTRGALFLEALTREDWRARCDRTRTDGNVHLRTGAWYRRHLRAGFLAAGGGVFVSKRAGVTLFELEGS